MYCCGTPRWRRSFLPAMPAGRGRAAPAPAVRGPCDVCRLGHVETAPSRYGRAFQVVPSPQLVDGHTEAVSDGHERVATPGAVLSCVGTAAGAAWRDGNYERLAAGNVLTGIELVYERNVDRKSTRLNSSHDQISYA